MRVSKLILLISSLSLTSCSFVLPVFDESRSEEKTIIEYLKKNGEYTHGAYSIAITSVIGSWYVTDEIYYSPSEKKFTSYVGMVNATSDGSITNVGGITFSWGKFSLGTKAGSTEYTVGNTTLHNTFSFGVEFGKYPEFEVKTFCTVVVQSESSVSADATMCSNCLTRAINNMVNTAPAMGATRNLW